MLCEADLKSKFFIDVKVGVLLWTNFDEENELPLAQFSPFFTFLGKHLCYLATFIHVRFRE